AADEVGRYQAIGISRILTAISEIVADLQLLVGVIAADQPVETIIPGLALEPQFLAEGLEAVVRSAAAIAVENIQIVEIGVLAARIFIVPVRSNRGELGPAEVVDELARNAPVLDVRIIVAAGRDRRQPRVRVVFDGSAETAFD